MALKLKASLAPFSLLLALLLICTGCSPTQAEHSFSIEGVWYLQASTNTGEESLSFSSVKDEDNVLTANSNGTTLTLNGDSVSLKAEHYGNSDEAGSYKLSSDDGAIIAYVEVNTNEEGRDTVLITSGYDNNVRVIGVRGDASLASGKSEIDVVISQFGKSVSSGKISPDMTGHDTYKKGNKENSHPSSKNDASGNTTLGKQNALKAAKAYLNTQAFSREGLIEQLEYEGYSHDEALYAVDQCGANWRKQAELAARQYLEVTSFSRNGLIEQLEYEGFTHEEAEYGVAAIGY